MEKKRYIPVKGRKIYVEKDLFDEYNRIAAGNAITTTNMQQLPAS